MNEFKRIILRTNVEEDIPAEPILINSSPGGSGTGTLDITNGQPLEVINLKFTITSDGTLINLHFSAPVSVGSLDPVHLIRTGTMTLNASGVGSSTYTYNPTSTSSPCLVEITGRSSGLTEGIGDSTVVS